MVIPIMYNALKTLVNNEIYGRTRVIIVYTYIFSELEHQYLKTLYKDEQYRIISKYYMSLILLETLL